MAGYSADSQSRQLAGSFSASSVIPSSTLFVDTALLYGPQGRGAAIGRLPAPQGAESAGGALGLGSPKTKSTRTPEISENPLFHAGRGSSSGQVSPVPYSPEWAVERARKSLKPPSSLAVVVDTAALRLSKCRSRVLSGASLIEGECRRGGRRVYAAMITLTYGKECQFDDAGTPQWRDVQWAPNHIRSYCERLRRYCARRGWRLPIVWTSELQQRGAVHYHVVVWLPVGMKLPKPDASGQWPHGSSRIERARRPVAYLAKYASKPGSKGAAGECLALPKGARLFGVSGLSETARPRYHWFGLPSWLQALTPFGTRARRVPDSGGFWHVEETGVRIRSPWWFEPGDCFGSLVRFVWRGFGPDDIQSSALLGY